MCLGHQQAGSEEHERHADLDHFFPEWYAPRVGVGRRLLSEHAAIASFRMRAVQITELSGPDSALKLADLPEPEPSHMLTPGRGVVVDVHSAGVSFPEVLQTRGEYQVKPPLPFVPGSEVGGVVRSVPDGASVSVGDRVAAFCMLGGFAEVAVAPEFLTFPLSEELDFAQGAGLILNYHTAYFALVLRGRFSAGESVLVHGAAGGIGTAALQVAKGLGARTIAVVSSDEKERVAREAGAAVNRLVDTGAVRPILGARFPLERAADALELLEGRGATGKVVLDVRGG